MNITTQKSEAIYSSFSELSFAHRPRCPEFQTIEHGIENLRSASALRLPDGSPLLAVAAGQGIQITRSGSTVGQLFDNTDRVVNVHLFTLPRLSQAQIWIGGILKDRGASDESAHFFKLLGSERALAPDSTPPLVYRALEPFTALMSNEGRYPKKSLRVSEGGGKKSYFLKARSNGGGEIWHSLDGSDQFIQTITFPIRPTVFTITSDPQRMAIAFRDGTIAIKQMNAAGLPGEDITRFKLSSLAPEIGSYATALAFKASDPQKPAKRDQLLVGTALGSVLAVRIADQALSLPVHQRDRGSIQLLDTDRTGSVHVYYNASGCE